MDKEVIKFMVKAKQAIFSRQVERIESTRPKSGDYLFAEGNLKYIDTFIGNCNFAGEEALWRDDVPFWSMNYIGRTLSDKFEIGFLTEALTLVSQEHPYRGPAHHTKGDFSYKYTMQGDFEWFWGVEEVFYKDEKVYELMFHGGALK
ncbi:MAG: DUF5680 domain-containing protein [Defluviitaleaceae bacterium]|nr:DUF5680 domain-containing protein [Defluviitaleaceae bacterium]